MGEIASIEKEAAKQDQKRTKAKSGGAVGKAYTSRQNKKYGGGVYPKVGNTGD